MAIIQGVNLPAPVVPYTTDDVYPSHYALYGKGGWRTMPNAAQRDAIPYARLEKHMVVVTEDDGMKWELTALPNAGVALNSSNWTEFTGTQITEIDGGTF